MFSLPSTHTRARAHTHTLNQVSDMNISFTEISEELAASIFTV
jgi:hypothetical protein